MNKVILWLFLKYSAMKSSPKINIKLIQGLSLISPNEFKEFVNFATSKYFSGERNYTNVLNLLSDLHKSDFRNYDNKSLIEFLMNELNLNKNTLLNRMSELYRIFEMFVVINELKYMPDKRNRILMEYYIGKESFKLFDYIYTSSKTFLSKNKTSAESIETESLLSDLASVKYFRLNNNKLFREQFSLKSEFEIFAFILKQLKNNIEFQHQKFLGIKQQTEIPGITLDSLPFDKIFERLKKIRPAVYKLTLIIYYMYLSFKDFSETKYFKKAKFIHGKIKSSLSKAENQFIYFLFLNYCMDQTNLSKTFFFNHLFKIIDEKLKEGYFRELTEVMLPANNFRDYVFIGLTVNKTEWVRSFIKNYSPLLPPSQRQDNVVIANAMIATKERKFEDVIRILSKVSKKIYLHYMDSAFLKLRAYYELRMSYEAFNEIERIKKYFQSNKTFPQGI
ncbi:MAG: hypothetical protein IPL53_14420 [Ignavibacteria bacterium]|nr:hypothetical protein [Ignavibacteria bacterium]